MDHYVVQYCSAGTKKFSGNILIKNILDLSLRTILFTITHVAGSAAPHLDFHN